ncbi:MAG TPA: DUF6686 family protein [Gemmatimonadales bacterium]
MGSSAHDDNGYEVAFETERGRLLHCACCGGLQLRFGNAVLGLNADDFVPFRRTVAELERDALETAAAGRLAPDARAVLYLGESGSGFAFDADEIVEMCRLLEGAAFMLELDGLIPPTPRTSPARES